MAAEKGAADLYRYAVAGLERLFQSHGTRSSIAFTGDFGESRNTVLSLLPQESSAADGLRFQVYFLRLCRLFHLSEGDGLALLPPRREPWTYHEGANEGFQGFFSNREDIDRLVQGLTQAQSRGTA
jgi:hypothetical protein